MANNFSVTMSVDTGNAKKNIEDLGKEFGKFDKQIDNAAKSLKGFDSEQDNNIKVVTNAKKEYRNLMKEIANVSMTLQGMTQAEKESAAGKGLANKLTELKQKAAVFKDSLADTNEEIKNLASDTRLTDGLGMVARTFGDVSTAIVALGGDADNMKKILMDIAKIQATVRAVESLTKAFQKQNLVLLKNPYVAVAAGIAALGVAIYEYAQKTDNATKSTNSYIAQLEKIGDAAEIAKYSVTDLINIRVNEGKINDAVNEYNRLGNSVAKMKEKLDNIDGDKEWYKGQLYYSEQLRKKLNEDIATAERQQDFQRKLIQKYQSENDLIDKAYNNSNKVSESVSKNNTELNTLLRTLKEIDTEIQNIFDKTANADLANINDDVRKSLSAQFYGQNAKYSTASAPVGITAILEAIDTTQLDSLAEKFKTLNAEQQKLFDGAIKSGSNWQDAWNTATGNISNTADQISNAAAAANIASTMFNSLGSSMDMPALNVLGVIAQSIANIALAYSDAFVKDQGSKTNIFAFIASVAAGVTSMIATIASVKNATAFADGGIVGGTTSIGDFNIARVNKGEMILNDMQQQHLFNLLQGRGSVANSLVNGEVVFKINGNNLVGVLSTQNKIIKKRG